MVPFQSAFHAEIHQNDIFFYFLKIIFDISTSKWFTNTKKISFKMKKIFKFWANGGTTAETNRPLTAA